LNGRVLMNPYVTVQIDLERIRANVREIAQRTGVAVMPVIKADAYGLGAAKVAQALAPLVEEFCIFQLPEAVEIDLFGRTGKRALCLGPPATLDPQAYIRQRVTPAISTIEQAVLLRAAGPAVCVDTGMQRFACGAEQLDAVIRAGDCKEAFTHGTRAEHAVKLKELLAGRGLRLHAAATSLLDSPEAYLDAVRPGFAIYRGAVRVHTTLVEVHDNHGAAGYGGFSTPRFGIILMGYSHGLRPGPCTVNDQPRQIIEVGMQSAYVEIGPADRVGDAVALLDAKSDERAVAGAWGTSPQEALLQLCRAGRHVYAGE
jgi:alanine racemase